jgi:hypothetical protein
MAEEKTIIMTPDSGSVNPGLASMYGLGGLGGFNNIYDLFGLALVASIFGWGNGFGGFGGFGGGGNGAAGFLSNQINNDSGRELLMNAITSQGEAGRTAIANLASAVGQDFNLVNGGVQSIQNAVQSLALQQAVSVPQIINALASGDASIISAFQKCCCDQKLLTVEQGYQSQIATLNQTNQLGSQADRNANALLAAINNQTVEMDNQFCALKEREMQAKIDTQADIIGQLRGQIDNANQTAAITGYVNSLVTPLAQKVDQIASKQLPTVNVQWPQLTAVNTTPYMNNNIYGVYGYGNNGWVF